MLFPSKIVDHEYNCVMDNEIKTIRLSDIKSKYIVLLFYPLDFTFVCPTEIMKFSDLHEKFKSMDTTVLFCSCDSVYSHQAWSQMNREQGGIGKIEWPLVSDISRKLCTQFNLLNEDAGTPMRSTVILDRDHNVLHISANIDPIGRSSNEVIRLISAFDFHACHGDVCYVDFEAEAQ